MAKSLVILLLCLSSVYSDPELKVEAPKDVLSEKVDDTSASVKSKRYSSWPAHPTPCPPNLPHYHQGWNTPKVNFIQPHYVPKPAVQVIKSNSLWNNPWQQNQGWSKPSQGWSKPSYGWPMSSGWNNNAWQSPAWQPGWKSSSWQSPAWKQPVYQSGWKPSAWQSPAWQPEWKPSGWQKPVWQSGWNKPVHSYAPSYHKPSYHNDWVKPVVDCPPWENSHSHTGIVYAPQHQYEHQPQIVKVVKPVWQNPQPLYHHSPSFHHPVHHDEPCD